MKVKQNCETCQYCVELDTGIYHARQALHCNYEVVLPNSMELKEYTPEVASHYGKDCPCYSPKPSYFFLVRKHPDIVMPANIKFSEVESNKELYCVSTIGKAVAKKNKAKFSGAKLHKKYWTLEFSKKNNKIGFVTIEVTYV